MLRLVRHQTESSISTSSGTFHKPATFNPPAELLRDIFGYTSPTDHYQILVLLSVCSAWRDAALGITSLFASADWDTWPVELLRLWCQRAGQTGLDVDMSQEGIHRTLADAEYTRLVDDISPKWHALSLEFDQDDESGDARDVHTLLSRWRCPNLRTLLLSELENEGQTDIFILPDDFAPYLEELILKDAHVIHATPWANLKRVSVNVDFWAHGTEGRDIFRTISYTDKLVLNGCSFSGIGECNIVLEGVKQLEIVDDLITGFAEWPLRHLSFPHTTKLVLRGMRAYASEFPDQDKVLWNSAFPELTSLTLQLLYPWFHMVLPLLSRNTGDDETLWFPNVTTLSLLAHDWKVTPRIPRASQGIEAALIRFLGTHAQHHRCASPMQELIIRGITISKESEKRLKSSVQNVEVQLDIFQDVAEYWPI